MFNVRIHISLSKFIRDYSFIHSNMYLCDGKFDGEDLIVKYENFTVILIQPIDCVLNVESTCVTFYYLINKLIASSCVAR